MPAVSPDTTPVDEPTLATEPPPLHEPPEVPSINVVVAPTHNTVVPAIAEGSGFTVNVFVIQHVGPVTYVIVSRPAAIPVIKPVVDPIVAIEGLLLTHVPPELASV